MLTFKQKHFHINTPYYDAWNKYGWMNNDWGFGLNKKKIDKLSKDGATIYVSYLKKRQLYTIKAKEVQKYPVDEIGWAKLKIYIIPRSSLNYCERKQEDIELKEMCESGVFG